MIVEETYVVVYYVCDGCGRRAKDHGCGAPEGWAVSQPLSAWGSNAIKCRQCKTDCQRCDGTGTVFLPGRGGVSGATRASECVRCTGKGPQPDMNVEVPVKGPARPGWSKTYQSVATGDSPAYTVEEFIRRLESESHDKGPKGGED